MSFFMLVTTVTLQYTKFKQNRSRQQANAILQQLVPEKRVLILT